MTEFKRYLRLPGNEPDEVDDEIAYHIEMKTEQLMREGYPEASARAEALRQFGDRDRIRHEVSDLVGARTQQARRAGMIDGVRQDLRFAVRQLRSMPTFTLVAVLTIALGLGATIAIFSVVRAVLLRPLPYDGADRIVFVGESSNPDSRDVQTTTSYPNYEDWKARSKSFEALGLFNSWVPTLTGLGDPERLSGSMVTHEVFTALRVTPVKGRPMLRTDNVPNGPNVVWISWELWQTRLGADPNVIGRSLTLGGAPREIVGVLPRGFNPPGEELAAQVWAPNYFDENDGRTARYLNVVGRLKPEVTLEAARAEFAGISAQLTKEYPAENKGQFAVLFPLRDYVIGGRTRGPLLLLMLASVLVLLIACANTSNLLIARTSYRAKEFAIRAALGTTRARVIRQLLTESLLLGCIGAAFGVTLAALAIRQLVRLAPEAVRAQQVAIDLPVFGFSVLIALGSAVLFGLLPALRATRGDVQRTLREEGRGSTAGYSKRLRGGLAVVQLSLALALVLCAGLLIKSFARVLQVNPGIRPDNLISFSLGLPVAKYPEESLSRFYEELVNRTASTPGIRAAAVSTTVPFSGGWDRVTVDTGSARIRTADIDLPEGDRYVVSASYFETLGIPVLRGRTFNETDRYDAPLVAVVDEVFARKVAPDGNAIGVRIGAPGRDSMATIVGIVGHVKHYGLDAESGGQIYLPHIQYPSRWMDLIARSETPVENLTPTLRSVVHSIDPERPVQNVMTMEDMMDERTAVRRFVLAMLSAFAGIALVLASVGLYGVIAFTIAQRQREFGIRLALGASANGLVRMVMREGAVLVGIGLGIGAALAIAGTKLISSFLFGVQRLDPIVLLGAAAVLSATAALAAWLPARRAAAADPLQSLHRN